MMKKKDDIKVLSTSPNWSSFSPESPRDHNISVESESDSESDSDYDDLSPTRVTTVERDESPKLFLALSVPNEITRKENLQKMEQLFQGIAEEDDVDFFIKHLPDMVRLSTECPFSDVRATCRSITEKMLKVFDVKVPVNTKGPSYFIPEKLIGDIATDNPQLKRLFIEIYCQSGRVSHLLRIISCHPSYAEKKYETFSRVMMSLRGPLQIHMRNYIAILAASSFKCSNLIKSQEREFLLNDGAPAWLQGVQNAPQKIQNLLELNAILAHQPWVLTKSHIEPLVKGADAWSIGELVHAMVIMSTFRSLATASFGCGATPELDLFPDYYYQNTSLPTHPSSASLTKSQGEVKNAETQKILQALKETVTDTEEESSDDEEYKSKADRRREMFEKAVSEDSKHKRNSSLNKKIEEGNEINKSIWIKYVGDKYKNFHHVDFDVRAKDYSVFRLQDYSWKEHGYPLLSRFYGDVSRMLDEQFDYIFEMTYHHLGEEPVDTTPFRKAVWFYVLRLFGMFNDDYDYADVNQFLNRDLKSFIKKVACFPHVVTKSDFLNIGLNLTPDETCHVVLLVSEAAKQAELLYGLYGVMKYML